MNNNRGNNRRRGRGNNRQQNGQQMNRIDSRARGNAPQLLEKYKKLAHDAMLNGDRVQEEYYHQFADHYFRVIADQKQRQEEARQPRRDDRGQDDGDFSDSYGDNGRDSGRDSGRERSRDNPRRGDASSNDTRAGTDGSDALDEGEERGRSVYEPADNPFVRDNRSGTKTRKPRRGKDDARDDSDEASADTGFDSSVLPPSIAISGEESDAEDEAPAEDKPAKRTRAKKAAPTGDKPKTTRPRKTAAKSAPDAESADEATGEDAGETKPRPRRRTTRKTASNDDTASSAAEAEA